MINLPAGGLYFSPCQLFRYQMHFHRYGFIRSIVSLQPNRNIGITAVVSYPCGKFPSFVQVNLQHIHLISRIVLTTAVRSVFSSAAGGNVASCLLILSATFSVATSSEGALTVKLASGGLPFSSSYAACSSIAFIREI